jgi:KipI family sensor histidine kinase inhibitor
MNISIAGENSLIIYFGEEVNPTVSEKVQYAAHHLKNALGHVIVDLVPSYASLLVIYDLFQTDLHTVRPQIRALLSEIDKIEASEGRLIELPVYYGLESGPDLEMLSHQTGLSVEDIIFLHQDTEYRVYAIGFSPGFAYLGEVDERIAAPRLASPRQRVPRGAVGIADRQTAIYPSISPGGWNLIGLSPQQMFDPEATPCMPVEVGDRVRFKAIGREAFLSLGGEL